MKKIGKMRLRLCALALALCLLAAGSIPAFAAEEEKRRKEEEALARERKLQQAALAIKKKFGKNALLKGMNLEEGATARDRNSQIGGHKA